MLVIKFSNSANQSDLKAAQAALASAKPQILNDCGLRLVGLAKIYFDNLSKGGSDFNGRKWPAPKPSTVKRRQMLAKRGLLRAPADVQGIVSGALQQSLTYQIAGTRLRVLYTDPAANYFTHSRPLLPIGFPPQWRTPCDEITQGRLDVIESTTQSYSAVARRLARKKT